MKSASWVAIQLKKPFLWAERMPFRFAEMIRGMIDKSRAVKIRVESVARFDQPQHIASGIYFR
jgi:hypothetical protein